ncbi:hypothetical protein ASZ78_001793 [Callipepla squamata]|uniref:Uncharacterized protein n=1 Tax=Callipepla squamata TaxID=9009 RepID=A0A226MC21_CALSU|nr:hypothetical protein ASZ78_001793 [Callipepla squamata]
MKRRGGARRRQRGSVPVLRKRPPPPQSRADLEGPKKRRVGPTAAPDLWVRPRNGSGDPQDAVGSDVGRPDPKEGAQRDPERDPKRTGNEHPEAQQEQLPHPKTHRETPKVARGCGAEGAAPQRGPREGCGADGGSGAEEGGADPDAERPQILRTAPNGPKTETPNPDPKGPQSGGRHSLEVDSDTDIEGEELNPDVPHVRKQRTPHTTPKGPPVVMETPNADPKGPQIVGYQNLEADGDTDIEGEELNPDVPHLRDHTSPQSAPKCPPVVMETPNADPKGPRSGYRSLEVDSDTDVEGEELNPNIPHLRDHRTPHMTPKCPTVVMETPNPDPKGPQSRGHESLEVDSDTDVEGEELNPDVPHPENQLRNHRTPHMTPKEPTLVMETPSPDPKGPRGGGHQDPEVGSDTDIEGEELNPDVPHARNQRTPHTTPKEPTVVMETPSPDPKGPQIVGYQNLEVDSDTDIEGEELNPDVSLPKNHLRDQRMPHMTPKEPTVGMETPNADPKGLQSGGYRSLEVDSDTDVEEELNPDVPHIRNRRMPHMTPKDLTVVMETPNADPKGPQSRAQNLQVDSDTDIEGEELNPDVPHLRDQRTPHMTPRDPASVMETPSPEPKGLQSEYQDPEVGSDTDVEGEELNPDVLHPENPLRDQRSPHMTPKEPTLVMETPNADPKGPQSGGHHILEVDSDTDVEEELNPDVPHLENHLRDHTSPHITPKCPTVVTETPNPDPKGPRSEDHSLEVDSDTDIEGDQLNPNVTHPENHLRDQRSPHMTPKDPPVGMETPSPDPKGPRSGAHQDPEVGSDTEGSSDAEEVFPTPHVRILRSRIPPQNSAVGSTAMGGSATVGHADPKGAKPTPKGQRSPLDPRGDGGVGRAGLEEPDPTPGMGDDPEPHSRAEQRDVDAPKTPKAPTPNERLAAGGQCRPHGDTDGDTEEEGAVPTDTAPEWDPEEPTQCFCRPEEEEEEEEEPPRSHVAAVTAPHGDPGTVTARSEDGYEVHVTPGVRPEPEQMRDIITCSGGTFLPSMPCTYGVRDTMHLWDVVTPGRGPGGP